LIVEATSKLKMERQSIENESTEPLRMSRLDFTDDDKYEPQHSEEILERVIRHRRFTDLFPMFIILLVLVAATGIVMALHMAAAVVGKAIEDSTGPLKIPWWNSHLAMVISLCISTLLGGLAVFLRMKKIDVILSTLLRKGGTRGDVFLDLMDGWLTSIRAVFTFDSPVSASLYTIALILLQFVPAFSGLCVSTTEAMWQRPQILTVTDVRPITMDAIGQLQFNSAISNLDQIFFRRQEYPTNFMSPSNDIAAANKFDNGSLGAFKITPTCQAIQGEFLVNSFLNGLNFVDVNITSMKGNIVAPGMEPGQINNGVVTGVNLYWNQYFVKKAYNYGTYPNGTMDYVDEIVALVKNTGMPSGQSTFNQTKAWNCRINIETFVVAIDNTTDSTGAVYTQVPKIIKRGANPSGSIYGPGGEGLFHSNVTISQFLGLAPFLAGGLPATRAVGDQRYLHNFHTSGSSTNLTADDLSLHLGDIALTLQLLTITGQRVNISVFRNGSTAYTAINIQGAASLLAVAWFLSFVLMIGIYSSQSLKWPAAGSSAALLSMTATKSFVNVVQPHSMGEWAAMRSRMGQHRWRLGRIYHLDENKQHYGISTAPFSD
jgi:hypothetical protein